MLRVTTWLNTRWDAMHSGYRDGDHMHATWTGEFDEGGTITRVLDAVFAQHNADDRPGGMVWRSLSVGDVIAVDGWEDGTTRWFAVQAVGFEEVGPVLPDAVSVP